MRLGLVVVLAAASCSKSSPQGLPPAASASSDCSATAHRAGAFLTAIDHEASLISLERVSPALRSDLVLHEDALGQAPIVEVGADGLYYQRAKWSRADLDRELADAHQRLHEAMVDGKFPIHDPPDPDSLVVVADAQAPWVTVVASIEVAHHTGFDHVSLVFRRPSATPPPPHTKVDDEIAKLMHDTDPGDKATALADYIRPKVAPCPALVRAFGEVGAHEEDVSGYLLSHVAPALIECDCAVSPEEIVSLMWNVVGNPKPIGILKLELDPGVKPIVAAADAPWSVAAKQIAADTTKLWLAVR